MSISTEDLDRYRQTRRRRDEAAREWQKEAHRQARRDAQRAASFLKDEFDAERVVLFGSVAQDEHLSPHSDIDLAVEGLQSLDYYRAVAQVQSIPTRASVDLIRIESCSSSLRTTIQNTGIEL